MALLNNEAALHRAKELTTTAMEHNMIPTGNTPSKTAENVYEFFKTLYENLSGNKAV